jgi:hypothetical protein
LAHFEVQGQRQHSGHLQASPSESQ